MKLTEKYRDNGYLITDKLISNNDVNSLREALNKEFENKNRFRIFLNDIKNEKTQEFVINKLLDSIKFQQSIKELKKLTNEKIYLFPPIEIMRNYQVNLYHSLGWHKDCQLELNYDYCKKIINSKDYFFSKVGFYLQENNEYGGSIDVIKKSFKFIPHHSKKQLFKNFQIKLNRLPLKIINFIHKINAKFYKLIPEEFYMKFLNAISLKPLPGSAIIFDTRIVHRGTPISKKVEKKIKFLNADQEKDGLYFTDTNFENSKFTIYCLLGTERGIKSYIYERLHRKPINIENYDELTLCKKHIEIIKRFNESLVMGAEKVIESINFKVN